MNNIIVKAPAKVNLYLKILGLRKDSYHNILTIFERISLADTIRISKIPSGIVIKSDKLITRDTKDNIAYKAALAILEYGKIDSGVKIEIRKNIPIASGLGGGSSDAAAVLKGINKLFKLRLSGKVLMNMAKKLGADVPFFMLDTTFAVGRGRGDDLKAIRSKNRLWHLIIKVGSKTATRDIYEAFDRMPKHLTPQGQSDKIQPLSLEPWKAVRRSKTRKQFGEGGKIPSKLLMDHAQAESMLHNDLERAVSLKKSAISRVSKLLAQLLGKKFIISGSGPSLFCLYRTRREATKARDMVLRSVSARSRADWQIFVA
jgi:4-diphosphocytidyl-2C-methyl-D-erythritol kinase